MPERSERSQSSARSQSSTRSPRSRAGLSFARRLLVCCTIAWVSLTSVAIASEYHGQVTFGGIPVPGSTVTVTATQGSKKVVAISDAQGVFSFTDLADGTWSLDIEMTGFAAIKQDITISPNAPAGTFELKLLSLDQIRSATKPVKIDVTAAAVAVSAPAPQPGAPAGGLPASPAKAQTAKTQATTAPAAPPPDTANSQPSDGLLINGSESNAATSQYSLAQAFGNTRNSRSLYNGGLYLKLDNSSFDAKTYSLTGYDSPKPEHNNMTVGINFQGPLKIPHLLRNGPTFYIQYERTENTSYSTSSVLVPTLAQEAGNFSGQTTAIYAPTTGLSSACLGAGVTPGSAFTGNIIPTACISPIAQNYLKLNSSTGMVSTLGSLYPMPNVTSDAAYNYQIPLPSSTHADLFYTRAMKQIGNKDYTYGYVQLQSTRSANTNIFNFDDKTDALNISSFALESHRFTQRLAVNASYSFSRSRTQLLPFFASRDQDVSAEVGITDNDRLPAYYGPPALGFSSGINGFSDASSSDNRVESNGLNVTMYWNRTRHNITAGGDFRRQEWNYLSEQNPEGSFTFTGTATQSSAGAGGSDFADFLLGIPDTSNISFGNADKYLRQSIYDLFFTDDFRVNPELSINAGARWEYSAPVTETQNRLVNLDFTPDFTGETPVLASNPTGALSGQSYPTSLVRPDKIGIAPNVAIAWRPISGSSLLVHSSYAIYHDTSDYLQAALAMAQQAPLSTSLAISGTSACPLALASAFTAPSCYTTTPATDTFALDPNFRVGYVQTWQLQVDRDLPASLHLTVSYNGVKGTRGVQEFLPNTAPPGSAACPTGPCGFIYRTSNGNSTREAGSVQLRRRLRSGLQASATYTYSKSLDDDYSLGGQGSVSNASSIAQNWLDLKAQRGLSTTDQRNLLNANVQYTTGMGLGGHTLLSGWRGAAYKEWTILTNITFGSGLPETPIDPFAVVPGTQYSGIVRANYTGQPIHASSVPGVFLNPAAFAAPAAGMWGDARRDCITGPTQFTLNGSMARTFRLHGTYNLDARLDATNPLNHVTYSSWNTTVGSPQFGAALQANGMRSMTVTIRLRF
jgi:hypothetical protein